MLTPLILIGPAHFAISAGTSLATIRASFPLGLRPVSKPAATWGHDWTPMRASKKTTVFVLLRIFSVQSGWQSFQPARRRRGAGPFITVEALYNFKSRTRLARLLSHGGFKRDRSRNFHVDLERRDCGAAIHSHDNVVTLH